MSGKNVSVRIVFFLKHANYISLFYKGPDEKYQISNKRDYENMSTKKQVMRYNTLYIKYTVAS